MRTPPTGVTLTTLEEGPVGGCRGGGFSNERAPNRRGPAQIRGERSGSQATHGNTYMELVDVHLQHRPHSGASLDELPLARDDAHLDRLSASREGTSGHSVDQNVDKGLSSASLLCSVVDSASRVSVM